MKNVLFLGLLLVGILMIVSCAPREEALAGEASKIGQSNTQKINKLEIKNVQKIVQDNPKIRNMVLKLGTFDPKLITRVAEDIESCSATPSCASPNYEVTATDCEQLGGELGARVESCYTCSVREDLRASAECAERWGIGDNLNPDIIQSYPDNVFWSDNGYSCSSGCVDACGITRSNPQTECVSACPTVETLSSPCPEGYTFTEYTPVIPNPTSEYVYFCIFSGATQYDPICNQCGSDRFADNTGNGDHFCMIRS